MVEVNRVIASKIITNKKIDIELNYPASEFGTEKIHIQTGQFRYELSPKEFRLLASGILSAFANLKTYKK